MAAINFPPNDVDPTPPSNGDTYSPPGLDTVYTYENGVWTGGVVAGEQFMPLGGGNFTGNVTFATDKIFLGVNGNANFTGDVDIDGNLALGSITDVEAALLAATGGTPSAISNGSATLNFNGSSILQSNTGYQPTLTNSYDLGAPTLTWKAIYSNALVNTTSLDNTGDVRIGGSLPATPNITLSADGSATFKELVSAGSGQYTNVCFSGTNRGDVPAGDNAVFFGQTANASGIIFGGGISGVGDTYNFKLLADGSAQFDSTITTTSLAGSGTVPVEVDADGKLVRGSATSNDIWIENNAQIYPAEASDSLLIGGTLPGSPNITLNADGSANLVEFLSAGAPNTTGSGGTLLVGGTTGYNGGGVFTYKTTLDNTDATANGFFVGVSAADDSTEKTVKFAAMPSGNVYIGTDINNATLAGANITLSANGSASFSGDVTVANGTGPIGLYKDDGRIELFSAQPYLVCKTGTNDAAGTKITLANDGSAEFAGIITSGAPDITKDGVEGVEVRNDGLVRSQRPSNKSGSAVFQGWLGVADTGSGESATNTSAINADGSASFAGTVNTTNSGWFQVTKDNGNAAYIGASDTELITLYTGASKNVILNANGTASFSADNQLVISSTCATTHYGFLSSGPKKALSSGSLNAQGYPFQVRDTGGATSTAEYTISSDGSTYIGTHSISAADPGANITLNANGQAVFNGSTDGRVTVSGDNAGANAYLTLQPGSSSNAYLTAVGGQSGALFLGTGSIANSQACVATDGSFQVGGTLPGGANITLYKYGEVNIEQTTASPAFTARATGGAADSGAIVVYPLNNTSDISVSIKRDGSASFAGTINVAPTSAAGNAIIIGNANQIVLEANGSGTFADTITADSLSDGTTTKTMTEVLDVASASGICAAFATVDTRTATKAILAQSNIASFTDDGGGAFTFTFTNPMPTANYAVFGTASGLFNGTIVSLGANDSATKDEYLTTTSFTVCCRGGQNSPDGGGNPAVLNVMVIR